MHGRSLGEDLPPYRLRKLRPVRVSSLQIDKYRLAIRRFRSCYLLYNRFPGKNIEINSAFKKKIRV